MKKISKVAVMLAIMIVTLSGCSKSPVTLKKEKFVIEYGKKVSLKANEYIEAKKEVLKETKISIKDLKLIEGKEYTAIGKYTGTAKYKEEKLSFTIEVKDTTAPKFVDFKKELEIEQGFSDNLAQYFKAEDLNEVSMKVGGKIDVNVLGTYKLKVIAKDNCQNETIKEVKVHVKEKGTITPPPSNQPTDTDNVGSGTTGGNTGAVGNTTNGANSGSNGSTGGSGGTVTPTPPPNVCVPGTPVASQIGNSGLWFPNEQAYLNWCYEIDSKIINGEIAPFGWRAKTIEDTCGNGGTIWTVIFY